MAPYGAQTISLSLVMTPAVWTMNPRFLLFFFLLVVLVHPVKSDNDIDERYYMSGKIRCLRCSAGTYVAKHCTMQDTLSTCESCVHGDTYSEHLTGLTECLRCKVCRADEEEVSPCTVTKNTICRCKKGTYCPSGDEPCEICQKCKTSCPPDQEIQAPCNSTSDTQCGPPKSASNKLLGILLPIGLLSIFSLAVVCAWYFYQKCNNSKWGKKILTVSFNCDEAAAKDIERFLPERPKLHLKENTTENEMNEAINKTFSHFVELVPTKGFEKFVRELGLTSNEIDWAKQDNMGTYNQHYGMLFHLHQDQKFDVNIWLNKLHDIKMGKVAQDITEILTKDGLFEISTQG